MQVQGLSSSVEYLLKFFDRVTHLLLRAVHAVYINERQFIARKIPQC
jgi:hypothetical protein